MSVRAKLSRRHSESLAKLLTEVVLGIEPAAPRDLRHAKIASLEQTRSFLESLLLQKVTKKAAGDAMKTAGHVLSRESELFGNGFHGDFLIIADAPADTLNE
jgi:hypothetical protein